MTRAIWAVSILMITSGASARESSENLSLSSKAPRLSLPIVLDQTPAEEQIVTAARLTRDQQKALRESIDPEILSRMALRHSCLQANVKDRSSFEKRQGPYLGLVNTFARSICRQNQDPAKQAMLRGSQKRTRRGIQDTVANFEQRQLLDPVSLKNFKAPDDRQLIASYGIILSLMMRETNGDYREGVDVSNRRSLRDSKNSRSGGKTVEGGLCQTSLDVKGSIDASANNGLDQIENEYRAAGPRACMTSLFSIGLKEKKYQREVSGKGEGFAFQRMVRSCPALAIEHCAITIRHNMTHYGPLIRGQAKPLSQCTPLLQDIYDYVQERRETVCPRILQQNPETQTASASGGRT